MDNSYFRPIVPNNMGTKITVKRMRQAVLQFIPVGAE